MKIPILLAQVMPGTGVASAKPDPGWTDLSLLDWHSWGVEVRIGLLWVVLFALGAIAVRIGWPLLRRRIWRGYRTKSVKMSFKGPEVEICPDHETRRIAYQAWVEIQTRKVGLTFEEDHDVIVEVYNSWYQVFGVLRDLCKTVPPECLKDDVDAKKLVDLLLASLNKGLRPHLTRWQAKFRRWYAAAIEKPDNVQRAPQEVQRDFPEYKQLVDDLRAVNREFVEFGQSLLKLAEGGK